jgi:outer membrane lipoprotein-sorting protein
MKPLIHPFFIAVLFLVTIFSFSNQIIAAETTFTLQGTITDGDTKQPIIGASLRVLDTRYGTYSGVSGFFRIALPKGNYTIEIKSLGYQSRTFPVSEETSTLTVQLRPSAVKLQTVQVTADIDADNVIRRAIERKEENLKKISTFTGSLYSKLNLELNGKGLNALPTGRSGGNGRVQGRGGSVGISSDGSLDERNSFFIAETFSKVYRDNIQKRYHAEILQRRQTANIEKQQNLIAIGNFVSFYDESIKIVSADILSPLSKDPFDRYKFTLKERTTLGDKFVYVIDVEPKSEIFPAFKGTLKIIEGTYNLVEADLSPSETTALSFVKNLRFVQKFDEIQKEIWQPTYLRTTAKAQIEVLKGFVEFGADFTATSIYSEMKINEQIPDSIFDSDKPRITVSPTADSTKTEFWENNALQELTDKEKEIYHRIDSIVIANPSDTTGKSPTTYSIDPMIDFNRIGSITVTAQPHFNSHYFQADANAGYSLGIHRFVGEISTTLFWDSSRRFSVKSKMFSQLNRTSLDRTYSPFVNSLAAAFEHQDYYDYFRNDGFALGASAALFGVRMNTLYEQTRQFSTTRLAPRSIFQEGGWRSNPTITEGSYSTLTVGIQSGNIAALGFTGKPQFELKAAAFYGEEYNRSLPFRAVEASLETMLPLIPTGYSPVSVRLQVAAGVASGDIPLQYQFRQRVQLAQLVSFGNMVSAPIGKFGGTEYSTVNAEINLTDVAWRSVGLPLYDGRGIDIIVAGASGRWKNHQQIGYLPTGNDWYSEIGFGLARIPTFFSNLIFLRFDARWGIGNIAAGNFGWGLGITLPF